jgi:DNA repair protein RadC
MLSKKKRLQLIAGDWTASEISIVYKRGIQHGSPIETVMDAQNHIRRLWSNELINLQEQLVAFYFNRAGKLIGHRLISTGSMISCTIDTKLIVSLALHSMACSVIIGHNHPSGVLIPSDADKDFTRQLKAALSLIDVNLLDSFIITERGFLSFANKSWI